GLGRAAEYGICVGHHRSPMCSLLRIEYRHSEQRSRRCVPLIAPQQHGAVSITAIRDHAGSRILHLPLAAAPPQLEAGLVAVAIAVQAPLGELPAAGVERQLTAQRDALAAGHEF